MRPIVKSVEAQEVITVRRSKKTINKNIDCNKDQEVPSTLSLDKVKVSTERVLPCQYPLKFYHTPDFKK